MKIKNGNIKLNKIEKKFFSEFFFFAKECHGMLCIRKWSYGRGQYYFAFSGDSLSYQTWVSIELGKLEDKNIVFETHCKSDVRNHSILWLCVSKKFLRNVFEVLKNDDILIDKLKNFLDYSKEDFRKVTTEYLGIDKKEVDKIIERVRKLQNF